MEKILKDYGFQDWQVERLLKGKELDTNHGIYKVDKDGLVLHQGSRMKKIPMEGDIKYDKKKISI